MDKKIHMVTFLLLIIGGLNWGLEGLFNWGIGSILPSGLAQIIYILIGLSAIYVLAKHKSCCKDCQATPAAEAPSDAAPMQ